MTAWWSTTHNIQGPAKKRFPGWENFVLAVAYHFCLALPEKFSQPGNHSFAGPCIAFVLSQPHYWCVPIHAPWWEAHVLIDLFAGAAAVPSRWSQSRVLNITFSCFWAHKCTRLQPKNYQGWAETIMYSWENCLRDFHQRLIGIAVLIHHTAWVSLAVKLLHSLGCLLCGQGWDSMACRWCTI